MVSSDLLSFAKDISPVLVQLVASAGFGIALAKFPYGLYEKEMHRASYHCSPPTSQYLLGAYTIYLTECPGHLLLVSPLPIDCTLYAPADIRFCLNHMASIAHCADST